jgi:PLAT/LH2 domain
MEAGQTDWVTIPSKDLGMLKSITIHNDGSGLGPEWKLHDITVYSARWLKPDLSYHYNATLNDWIDGDSSKTLPFRVDEYVRGGFASSSDGTVTNSWKRISEGYDSVAPGVTLGIILRDFLVDNLRAGLGIPGFCTSG